MVFTLTFEIGPKKRLSSVVINAETWDSAATNGVNMLDKLRRHGKRAALVGVGNGDYSLCSLVVNNGRTLHDRLEVRYGD